MVYLKNMEEISMKHIKLKIVILIFFLIIIHLQFGRKIKVTGTEITTYQCGYSQNVTVVANKLIIFNTDKYGRKLLVNYFDNTFQNVKFSLDIGYANEIIFCVYLNEWNKYPSFKIKCTPCFTDYSLVDVKNDPDFFSIDIERQ